MMEFGALFLVHLCKIVVTVVVYSFIITTVESLNPR